MSKYLPEELAQLGHSAHVWLKLLQAREARVLNELIAEFHAGTEDYRPLVTEFAVIRDQIKEIENALNAMSAKP